jgi:hypothetical protein
MKPPTDLSSMRNSSNQLFIAIRLLVLLLPNKTSEPLKLILISIQPLFQSQLPKHIPIPTLKEQDLALVLALDSEPKMSSWIMKVNLIQLLDKRNHSVRKSRKFSLAIEMMPQFTMNPMAPYTQNLFEYSLLNPTLIQTFAE